MPCERERIVSEGGYVSLGPPSGPMMLDLLSRTLAARWAHGTPRCPANWRHTLQQRFPKLFTDEDPNVGPGWSWLFEAGAVAIRERGVPRNFTTQQTKESLAAPAGIGAPKKAANTQRTSFQHWSICRHSSARTAGVQASSARRVGQVPM